ncbi:MAG: site-2 protease family protein [Candidatus Bathyarchaeota archaeon]|nr:MAG: site-2 protease family protein [Candidatus Bathyarchaeota archaeon]
MSSADSVDFFFDVSELVSTEFDIKDSFLKDSIPTFVLSKTVPLKDKYNRLRNKLKQRELEGILKKWNGDILLQVISIKKHPAKKGLLFKWNVSLILFIATLITVTISGYLTYVGYLRLLKILGEYHGRPFTVPNESVYLLELTALYVISIMGAIGLHEVGHTIACRLHHIEASLPTFIPGIPGTIPGTFGAIIMQKEPALNRDQLFDIGLMGPLIGFIASVIVSTLGYSLSIPVSQAEYLYVASKIGHLNTVFPSALFLLFQSYVFPAPTGFEYLLHPLAVAGWISILITFLNVFPIGQFDGGHVARAILGPKWHRRLSFIMTGFMIVAGWWTMAIFISFFMRADHPGTLDDVSDLSTKRKIGGILLLVIFASCFTLSSESPLLFLQP